MITALEETWDGGPQLRLIVSYFDKDTRSPGEGVDELRDDPFWKEKLEEGERYAIKKNEEIEYGK